MSGNSSLSPDGRIIAPLRLCAPHALPFSTTATGTSPSRSIHSESSARSWSSRLAQASPAGPPPTITTPTSIRSSSGSSSRLMNSLTGSTGGGNSLGATAPLREAIGWSAPLLRLDRLGQLGQDLVEVANYPQVREL